MPDEIEAEGQCQCGDVRLKVKGKPLRMAQCHCRDCQRATGTGHASNATFRQADVSITGATHSFATTADSGNTLTRHFCPRCGSRIFIVNSARPAMVTVTAGIFDDSSWFEPQAVLYTKYRPRWDATSDAVPNFEAMGLAPAKRD